MGLAVLGVSELGGVCRRLVLCLLDAALDVVKENPKYFPFDVGGD